MSLLNVVNSDQNTSSDLQFFGELKHSVKSHCNQEKGKMLTKAGNVVRICITYVSFRHHLRGWILPILVIDWIVDCCASDAGVLSIWPVVASV